MCQNPCWYICRYIKAGDPLSAFFFSVGYLHAFEEELIFISDEQPNLNSWTTISFLKGLENNILDTIFFPSSITKITISLTNRERKKAHQLWEMKWDGEYTSYIMACY